MVQRRDGARATIEGLARLFARGLDETGTSRTVVPSGATRASSRLDPAYLPMGPLRAVYRTKGND